MNLKTNLLALVLLFLSKSSITLSQESLFEFKKTEREEKLSAPLGYKVFLIDAKKIRVEGEDKYFLVRLEKVKKEKKKEVHLIIDRYSSDFTKEYSWDFTGMFDGEEEGLFKWWPGNTKFEVLFSQSNLLVVSHNTKDKKYRCSAQVLDYKNSAAGKRIDLVSARLNKKEKSIQAEVKVSPNGEYFALINLPYDQPYLTNQSVINVYNKTGEKQFKCSMDTILPEVVENSSQRVLLTNKGGLAFLGLHNTVLVNQNGMSKNPIIEDSLSFGDFYYYYPDRWMVSEQNVITKSISESEYYGFSYSYKNSKTCDKVVQFKYDSDSNKVTEYHSFSSAPKKDFVAIEKVLEDNLGNLYVFGERKVISNSLMVNNKNHIGSIWTNGFIYVSKFDSTGALMFTRSIQRKYTGSGFGTQFLPIVKDGKACVFYKSTKNYFEKDLDDNLQVLGAPSSAQSNWLIGATVYPNGKVKREKAFELNFDTNKNYFNGLMLQYRYATVGDEIIYLSWIKDLKTGTYKITRLSIPD